MLGSHFLGMGEVFADVDSIRSANNLAVEYFDLGEYDTALAELSKNHTDIRSQNLAKQPIEAETLMLMGVVMASGKNQDAKALELFKKALIIDKEVAVPKISDKLSTDLFQSAKDELYPKVDCGTLLGISHNQVTQGEEGQNLPIAIKADNILQDKTTLKLHYRKQGEGGYKKTDFKRGAGCEFVATIPGGQVEPPEIQYYVTATMKDGRPGAQKGAPKTPFAVNVIFGATQKSPEAEPEPDMESITEAEDETPDLATVGKVQGPRGSGCAGCHASEGWKTGLFGLLMLFLAFSVQVRRRR